MVRRLTDKVVGVPKKAPAAMVQVPTDTPFFSKVRLIIEALTPPTQADNLLTVQSVLG